MYSPNAPCIFLAAYAGALAGMGMSQYISDGTVNDSNTLSAYAGAWAEQFDTAWGSVRPVSDMDEKAVLAGSLGVWRNRTVGQNNGGLALSTVVSFSAEIQAIISVVTAAENFFTANSISQNCAEPGSGIDQLTQDVLAGPGAGSVAATVVAASGNIAGTFEIGGNTNTSLTTVNIDGENLVTLQVGGSNVAGTTQFYLGFEPARTGILNLPNAANSGPDDLGIVFRNAGNTGDVSGLGVDGTNIVNVGGSGAVGVKLNLGATTPLGVLGQGLTCSATAAISIAASHVLTSTEYNNPVIELTGACGTSSELTFPNLPGIWFLDLANCTFAAETGLGVVSGSGSASVVGTSTPAAKLCIVRTSGANTIVVTFVQ